MTSHSKPEQPYTIVRIKRKRNEEPLDALVVESAARRKKYRGGTSVFQFARTVEDGVWEDDARQKEIQNHLARLARELPASTPNPVLTTPSSPPKVRHQPSESTKRFTIVERNNERNAALPAGPPPIIPSKELETRKASVDFKMYDAVPEPTSSQEDIDPALEKIMPMLRDYLKVQEPSLGDSASNPAEDGDYVWDLFYHRPGTFNDWTQTATVGTVSGLPPLGTEDSDSDFGSEEEDEADEDSNAEEYYKNDYPDEEESDWSEDDDSDEFHEHSDHDDAMHYGEDGSDHDWR